jgi:chromate reductase
MTYSVGYFVGSLAAKSINRTLSKALVRLAPAQLELQEIPIKDLPLYNRDLDGNYPAEAQALKDALARVDAVLFVTPEYNRDIPGSLKNAIDWASRPWGQNSFSRKPSAMIGVEAYIQFTPGLIDDDGEVTDETTEEFLRNFMNEFEQFITRVLTVLPRTR